MTAPSSSPEAWLESRESAPPPSIRRAVARRLAESDPGRGSVAERLAAAGLAGLAAVASGAGDRATAQALLAVDALLTYALEAAAEEGREALDRLLASLDVERFESLLQTGPGIG